MVLPGNGVWYSPLLPNEVWPAASPSHSDYIATYLYIMTRLAEVAE
jgi:hypothetical protein